MDAYENLFNCRDINKIIDSINDMLPASMCACCHGRYHVMCVVDVTERILQSLSHDARTIELGKIAALLHDIGSIAGRRNHARKGAALASVLLDDLANVTPEEKSMIIQAIEDHSDGNNISSAIGAAVFIADKVHIIKRRVRPLENIDAWHSNLLEIEDMELCISGNTVTINFKTTEAFSKELLLDEYKSKLDLIMRAAEYLGCTCDIHFSGIGELP